MGIFVFQITISIIYLLVITSLITGLASTAKEQEGSSESFMVLKEI